MPKAKKLTKEEIENYPGRPILFIREERFLERAKAAGCNIYAPGEYGHQVWDPNYMHFPEDLKPGGFIGWHQGYAYVVFPAKFSNRRETALTWAKLPSWLTD